MYGLVKMLLRSRNLPIALVHDTAKDRAGGILQCLTEIVNSLLHAAQ